MKRYQLRQLYTLSEFNNLGKQIAQDYNAVAMNPSSGQYDETINFVMSAIYGYFYADLVAYFGETKAGVRNKLYHRLGLDLSIKLPYWYKKYKQIKKLLTTEDLSLLQTSKMTSTSSDNTDSASGTLQKTATTPTGVSTGTATDGFDININDGDDSVETTGFADKYTNAQQKFANASKVKGTRSSEILREGSIDDLLNVLEKLPSSFANEVLKDMQKHFIYDYDGELDGIYNFTEGDFGMGIIIGQTRTNQPVEETEGFEDAVKEVLAQDVELGGDLDVDGDVNAKGVYGDEIIEKMSGYSMNVITGEINWSPIYGGIVKNGNKLTIVVFGSFTYANDIPTAPTIVDIVIPSSIGDKLTGFYDNVIDGRGLPLLVGYTPDKNIAVTMRKINSTKLAVDLRNINSSDLVVGTTYTFRYEATFLLSDNMAE